MTVCTIRRITLGTIILLVGLLVSACNFPGMAPTPDLFATSAAQTVAARQTLISMGSPPSPPSIATTPPGPPPITPDTATATLPPPTLTPSLTPTITQTMIPCDRASFVKDVTIPDGEEMSPNENFTKTWRLKNTGSCTWTSGYALVFDSGDSMSGPASVQLTSGTVGPGGNVDISVNLKAPSSPGTYKGFWKLRNGSGVIFGIGDAGTVAFWVEIEVVPNETTVNISHVAGESGFVDSTGFIDNDLYIGDNTSNSSAQAFVSFNISGIPSDAVITKVATDISNYNTTGDPFGDLGCMYIYKDNYGGLNPGDYEPTAPSSGRLIAWCSTGALDTPEIDNDVRNALQSMVGSSRFKVRFQFAMDTNGDSSSDYLELNAPKLKVTYYTP